MLEETKFLTDKVIMLENKSACIYVHSEIINETITNFLIFIIIISKYSVSKTPP